MPFPIEGDDGCINSGLTCPLKEGVRELYFKTLYVRKIYPEVCMKFTNSIVVQTHDDESKISIQLIRLISIDWIKLFTDDFLCESLFLGVWRSRGLPSPKTFYNTNTILTFCLFYNRSQQLSHHYPEISSNVK